MKLYKSTLKCKICGRTYGSDLTSTNESGVCPVCTPGKYARAKKLFGNPNQLPKIEGDNPQEATKLQKANQISDFL
jgi:hypothetical protein